MQQPTRKFTLEFKQEAVRLLKTSGKSASYWRKELCVSGEDAFPGKGHQTELEEELRRLRRENDILRQERDILKRSSP